MAERIANDTKHLFIEHQDDIITEAQDDITKHYYPDSDEQVEKFDFEYK